jgi:hypothetical protein
MKSNGQDAAVAAIQFALETDDGLTFLRLWNQGDFDTTRREWPEAPEAVYIGADPLHHETTIGDEIDMAEVIASRVRADQSVYIVGPLDDVQGRLHVALVNRLRQETGKQVHVIYS